MRSAHAPPLLLATCTLKHRERERLERTRISTLVGIDDSLRTCSLRHIANISPSDPHPASGVSLPATATAMATASHEHGGGSTLGALHRVRRIEEVASKTAREYANRNERIMKLRNTIIGLR